MENTQTIRQSSIVWSNDYWDISKLDGHNTAFNFILSGRGSGKTVRLKKKVFDNWFTKKETFIWVLRSDSELDHAFYTTFFAHFEHLEHLFYFKGNMLLLKDGDITVGIFASMTNINRRVRKIHMIQCSTMVFDEFILNPYAAHQKYKKSEVDDFMNAYETIARNFEYKTKVYWLGNPIVIVNPYFLAFKIDAEMVKKNKGKIYKPYQDISIDYFDVPEIVLNKKLDSPYGRVAQLMDGRFFDQVFMSEEQFESNVVINKNVPTGYRLQAQIKASNMTLYFFTNGSHYYVTNQKATIEKHPTYHTFDITEWDGKDITVIDSANPVKNTMAMTFTAIRNNRYSVSSENVHYVVQELLTLLR